MMKVLEEFQNLFGQRPPMCPTKRINRNVSVVSPHCVPIQASFVLAEENTGSRLDIPDTMNNQGLIILRTFDVFYNVFARNIIDLGSIQIIYAFHLSKNNHIL
jgi:hypothetical protein